MTDSKEQTGRTERKADRDGGLEWEDRMEGQKNRKECIKRPWDTNYSKNRYEGQTGTTDWEERLEEQTGRQTRNQTGRADWNNRQEGQNVRTDWDTN